MFYFLMFYIMSLTSTMSIVDFSVETSKIQIRWISDKITEIKWF